MAGKRADGPETAVQPAMERLDLLKPDAIGIAQATVIGMATSAPAARRSSGSAVRSALTSVSSPGG